MRHVNVPRLALIALTLSILAAFPILKADRLRREYEATPPHASLIVVECAFDGAFTSGDWVVSSLRRNGYCTAIGRALELPERFLGRALGAGGAGEKGLVALFVLR